jgi:hypothetical protein
MTASYNLSTRWLVVLYYDFEHIQMFETAENILWVVYLVVFLIVT